MVRLHLSPARRQSLLKIHGRILCLYTLIAAASSAAAATSTSPVKAPVVLSSISANPAAVNIDNGTGEWQRHFYKKYGIKSDDAFKIGVAWLGDINQLFSGGIPNPDRTTSNSAFLLSGTLDTEKFGAWRGGSFSAEFLQLNAQATNTQAGTVQGYNSVPGPLPLNRSEIYQLWYRQALFDDKFVFRIGKSAASFDFANVIRPVPLAKNDPTIPAVTSLIMTPVYTAPNILGVLPGFYNSAYGLTFTFAPIREWYLTYAIYDGNLASGQQTGLHNLPDLNGAYFQIAETGAAWLLGKDRMPGTLGLGLWHQHGELKGPPTINENSANGYYLFGSQRVWYRHPGANNSGFSVYYQYGTNTSRAMLMNQYVGTGFTAFGLTPNRPNDSFGAGGAFSWMNTNQFNSNNELLLQAYYQAKLFTGVYVEPVISYIPNPASNGTKNNAWAGTLRFMVLG